jgi:hypothetical protein
LDDEGFSGMRLFFKAMSFYIIIIGEAGRLAPALPE